MNIVEHPSRALLAEAEREREVVESPEGQAWLTALMEAARAYWDFLERNHLTYEDDRVKATALVVTVTLCRTTDVTLKDGALDRVFGNGQNPDPDGRGPADIPHNDELI
jgi:hypothetical protein